jgi:ubiquinone biosynthesis protein UbiJ
MLDSLPSFVRSAVVPRVVLLVNHVLAAEPAAVVRLKPLAGRRLDLRLTDLPGPLARAAQGFSDLSLRVTPAGLFEWVEAAEGSADLVVAIDASNPLAAGLQAMAGGKPAVRIEGDAAFAAEVSWLLEHLRWDLEDDLGRLVGPPLAHELARVGRAVKPVLARFAAAAADLAARLGPKPGAGPGDRGPEAGAGAAAPGPTPR